ncbi:MULTISPECIES: LacI family DNA-binding transcriptional regulator [unclassified Leifsonia]|uniref:LacI family DNA-binding transcriptional regulator n=1 Tax=unclassified Leifsonia TaxID=2663824 RepID=UPI0008A7ADBE|nr:MULTISPECIES: LacI family DNA-binding transcriptional regulator [unclassified Leifsonia]SEI14664.1 transcriptional regulator, LacI family [Leifsonia sp. CL154]SFM02367.1 transcriptional regulator, LacI family [Leifsonia sp. CL147]
MESRGRPTLRSIADAAGVSVATVSKVVNQRSDVSAATRARVERLLAERDYPYRSMGRPPSSRRVIELAFDALTSPNIVDIIRGAVELADTHGFEVVIAEVPDDALGIAWARRLTSLECAGVILVTATLTTQQRRQLARLRIPIVGIDTGPLASPATLVTSDNEKGAYEVTRHLVGLGHQHICLIAGPDSSPVSMPRQRGFESALSDAGLAIDGDGIRESLFTVDGGFAAASYLLAREPRPTAIVASNDLQALGALQAARRWQIPVPDSLSISGFDDTATAKWCDPPLTTVRQQFSEMGREAVRRVSTSASHSGAPTAERPMPVELVVRASTAPPGDRPGNRSETVSDN